MRTKPVSLQSSYRRTRAQLPRTVHALEQIESLQCCIFTLIVPVQVELGGANDANNALHDRIHRSKRARPGAPNGNARTGSANHGATVSTSTATGPRTVPNSSPALFNPYAAARPPAGGSVRGARMVPASPRSHRTAESAKGGNEGRGHMPLNDGAVNGQSAHKGGSASSGDIGRGGVGVKPGGGGYAEWKDRVLTSMENRVKESAAASSARAVHGGCSSTMSAGAVFSLCNFPSGARLKYSCGCFVYRQ